MAEPVTKITPMGVMILALLSEDDMHPYEMVRLLRQRRDDRLLKITNGTLYHSVARLLEQDLIAEVGVDREGNRPERTTYTLTPRGGEVVRDWVRRELSSAELSTTFRVALAEAHNLDRQEVVDLLRIRQVALEEEHALHAYGIDDARARGVPLQFLLEIERQQVLLHAELEWMRSLIDRLEADEIPWGPAGFEDSDRYRAQRKAARR
ncbi:PadR family transcriptional regulator [Microbacterium sp. CIAB417]|uniref:PadR family transcriptional regulator n=1 Tax=Microbacterium sp. CIAB417 TaxID=2860287 RepID=UPI001FAD3837|nr:PadR family transcriptional regulator [Microbacterium sp. CIAB417]